VSRTCGKPGSIFKVITWSAGLDSGTITPHTTMKTVAPIEVGGRVMRNWDYKAHGLVTMEDGLAQSLNVVAAFYQHVGRQGALTTPICDALASED